MKQKKTHTRYRMGLVLFLAVLLLGSRNAAKAEEAAKAEPKLKGDCYYWEDYVEPDEVIIVGIRKGVKNPHIPDKINGKKVREIYLEMENGEKNIDTLEIPKYLFYLPQMENGERIKGYKVHAKSKEYSLKAGCLYSKDGKTLMQYPNGKKTKSFTVPKGTKEIFTSAFADSLVEKVTLPDSIKEIGLCAFERSKLKHINLPSGLKVIGTGAFSESALRSIAIPKSVRTIEFSAFRDCKQLRKVTIPKKNHLVNIEENAFRRCSRLKEFIYPKPILRKSDDYSWYPFIGANAFRSCIRLKKVELPDTLQWLGYRCFYNCRRLEEITLINVSSIGIQTATFYNCKSLKKVTLKSLSNDLIQIEEEAFQGCGKLKKIYIHSESKEGRIAKEAFAKKGKKKKLTIVAPKGSYAYQYAKKHKKQGFKVKELK